MYIDMRTLRKLVENVYINLSPTNEHMSHNQSHSYIFAIIFNLFFFGNKGKPNERMHMFAHT